MFLYRSDSKIGASAFRLLTFSIGLMAIFCGNLFAAPQHVVDFNGDGKTDFSIVRNVSGSLVWYTYDGVSTPPAGITGDYFGLTALDDLTPEDYDGDSKTDIAIWRPGIGGVAGFYILQSTNNTIRFDAFGITNDNPAVVADWDGDNKADPAVYRCPSVTAPSPGQCFFYYRGSLNNPAGSVTGIPWGFGRDLDFTPYNGDFDGDGKNDVCIIRRDPNNVNSAQFILQRSSDAGVEFINWGFLSDFPITGDYDGDGKTDICVRRNAAGVASHYVLTRFGTFFYQQWGLPIDQSTPGDYDGDGTTDFAVWRGSSTPGLSNFYVLNSGSGTFRAVSWGQCASAMTCDLAVATYSVPQ